MSFPALNPVIQSLVDDAELRQFSTGKPRESSRQTLSMLQRHQITDPHEIGDEEMVDCCHAGLWLANHFLDDSHAISQRIDSPTGSWWHGIMHRREGDFSNAKYWFRQVGVHPAMATLAHRCQQTLEPESPVTCWKAAGWDPVAFVDLCQQATHDPGTARWCNEIAYLEWVTLFEFCFDQAVSS